MTVEQVDACRTVHPNDCLFVLGLPVTLEQFAASRHTSAPTFARGFAGGWIQYEALFRGAYMAARTELRQMGVRFLENPIMPLLKQEIRTTRVVLLFSHWGQDGIELGGEFVSAERVVDGVPESYSGVIDLCVCHPIPLVDALLAARPGAVVKYTRLKATRHHWLQV